MAEQTMKRGKEKTRKGKRKKYEENTKQQKDSRHQEEESEGKKKKPVKKERDSLLLKENLPRRDFFLTLQGEHLTRRPANG